MKIKACVYAVYRPWSKSYDYIVGIVGMGEGWIPVWEQDIEFDAPPDETLQAGTVAAYRAEQQRIRAEAEAKVANLEQTIRDMQCIEDKRVAA